MTDGLMSDLESFEDLLDQLALKKGLEPEYQDIWGQSHPASFQTKIRILSAMGYCLESLADLKKALQKEEGKEWGQITDTVQIISQNTSSHELVFQIPLKNILNEDRFPADIGIELEIKEEFGTVQTYSFSSDQMRFVGAPRIDQAFFLRGSLRMPEIPSLGYHDGCLTVRRGEESFRQTFKIIICPEKAYLPPVLRGEGKRAGLMVSLAALRSKRNWGIGDFRDLKELVRWAIEVLGVDVIGLLPLHALANREPYNISPYYPSSRLYRNPIYLSVPEVDEYQYSLEVWKFIMTPDSQNLLKALRDSEKVQFEKTAEWKIRILRHLFQTFLERHWKAKGEETERQKKFLAYLEQEADLLERYATYCALEDYFRRESPELQTWGQWPASFQDPDSAEVKAFRQEHRTEILFHKYLQWQVEEQLSGVQTLARQLGAEIGLYQDLALGSDPWGADSWAWPDYTVPGMKAGCPPDEFAPKGQEWGFYPPNGERHRQEGYQFFAQEMRKNCHPAGALRIDHVLKLSRLFWIPDGCTPGEGAYVNYLLDELIPIIALESVRNKTLIIGEDLGTLPDGLREILQAKGFFSYRLFYFEKDQAGHLLSPEAYPELALASVSTHDLPPLVGFWGMEDISLRKSLGLFPTEDHFHQAMAGRILEKRRMIDRLHQLGFLSEEDALNLQAQEEPDLTEELVRSILAFLVATRAKLTVLSQEDLFREKHQFNLPGTTNEYPNWSRKMRFSLEDLREHPEALRLAEQFRDLIVQAGRGVIKSGSPSK